MYGYLSGVEATDSMIILVIGNGFDLAHGLPTRYTDFLEFCQTAQNIAKGDMTFYGSTEKLFSLSYNIQNDDALKKICVEKCGEVSELITSNLWYEYLIAIYQKQQMRGENWIDFESEISYIIFHLDNISQDLNDLIIDKTEGDVEYLSRNKNPEMLKDEIFMELIQTTLENYENCTFKALRKILLYDLKKLIKALNIYCTSFIEEMFEKSPSEIKKDSLFERIQASLLVSFNYTHTYQKMYGEKRSPRTFYPHGECNAEKYPGACDLVLGIDEYWTDGRKDTHTNYNVFKKYVQRIQKETYRAINGLFEAINEYRLTVDTSTPGEPKAYEDLSKEVELYFFGHSLDITDKDILYKLLSIKQVSCTIFCKDEETQGDYIANVVKIIGQDELIKRMEQGKIDFLVSHE